MTIKEAQRSCECVHLRHAAEAVSLSGIDSQFVWSSQPFEQGVDFLRFADRNHQIGFSVQQQSRRHLPRCGEEVVRHSPHEAGNGANA